MEFDWLAIAGYGVGILGLILGSVFAVKWVQAVKLMKELGEAFTRTALALEDKKLTKDEAMKCLKEWNDVVVQILLLFGKK